MDKKIKIFVFGAIAVLLGLIALVIVLIVKTNTRTVDINALEARADSLQMANEIAQDQMALTNEFNQLNAEFSQYEGQQIYLKNDSLVQKYNAARMKIEGLIKELNEEKKKNKNQNQKLDTKALEQSRAKIKQLEGEIATLKGIVRHYLEEITRLGEENKGLKQEIQAVQQKNEQLSNQVTQATTTNRELTQTVAIAKKLNITGVSFNAYNKKGKVEKNVTKAKQLGVSFSVSPNATASAGMKTFYMRIISPEGALLGGGGNFTIDGQSVQSTASRSVEYDNEETPVSIYWDVNTTLTPGDYTVEVFCDGNRLASRHFTLSK